jgi:hypothetical protein
MAPELRSLTLVDPPAAWEALGFVVTDGVVAFDGVCLRLSAGAPPLGRDRNPTFFEAAADLGEKPAVESGKSSGSGTPATNVDFLSSAGLGISEVAVADLDGVPLVSATPPPDASVHPNGVTGIDHFLIVTPDFDRTAAALNAAGMPFRRTRDAGGFRQGFRRLGPAILEVVEALQMQQDDSSAHSGEAGSRAGGRLEGPARFWGLTLIASELDQLAVVLGDRLHAPKDAVQPGRRIATLDRSAGLHTHVAFMTPESGQSRS